MNANNNYLDKKKWDTTNLASKIARIDRNDLFREYEKALKDAPHRKEKKDHFFMPGHDGCIKAPGDKTSNRFEERLAMALWRFRGRRWPRPDGAWFQFLDYQFPLKAAQEDKGVGKIDLLGVTSCKRLLVTELKVAPEDESNRGDSPMDALMQGLRYAAIVVANSDDIASEAKAAHKVSVDPKQRPIVQILAPKNWWRSWFQLKGSTRRAAGPWEGNFAALIDDIKKGLGIAVECLAMDDIQREEIDLQTKEPTLETAPNLYPVCPGEEKSIGQAL